MIKKFENFIIDSILDKINNSGIDSLTKREKEILKAHSEDDAGKIEKFSRQILVYGDIFNFTCEEIFVDDEEDTYYEGVITLPNLTDYINGDEIEIKGKIWEISGGQLIPIFEYSERDDLITLTVGYEIELENFLEKAVKEIKRELKLRGIDM
jgi:hypothetical protein